MIINDSIEGRAVKNVVSTMAIEQMFLSKSFVEELLKVSKGEKSSEELRQETLRKYSPNLTNN